MCQLARVSRTVFYRCLQEREPLEESMEVRSASCREMDSPPQFPLELLPGSTCPQRVGLECGSHDRRGVGSQTAVTTWAHSRCGRSAEDGSSRVPLPSGRTPRPFAVRVPRGPHSTPPIVRAGPTPTVVGCSRAAPEKPLPKDSYLAARNPSAPPIRPDPTTLRPRPDSPACFAIATPSPAPRPPSALRFRRLTTFQVQDA